VAGRHVHLEPQVDGLTRGDGDWSGGARGREECRPKVVPDRLERLVDQPDAVDEDPASADEGEAQPPGSALSRGVPRAELDGGAFPDRGLPPEPDQRGGSEAVLGEQLGAVLIEETEPNSGSACDGVGQLVQREVGQSGLHNRTDGVSHVDAGQRGPEPDQRRDGVLGEHRSAAAPLRASVGRAIADDRDRAQRGAVPGKGGPTVADAVLEQDCALGGRLSREGDTIFDQDRLAGSGALEGADPLG
jgi:hypothetical protein